MKRWACLGQAQVPGGDTLIELFQRDQELAIRVGGRELMNSRMHGSEDALAAAVCAHVGDRPRCRLLVGGLGMGFTLAEALRRLGPDAEVVVAELVPEVVAWNRGVVGEVAGRPLDDPRVRIHERDVGLLIRHADQAYDGILLDVDNGPEGLVREANDWLYEGSGLEAARDALRPGGVLAVWSATPEAAFKRRMWAAGFEVDEHVVRARGDKGPKHWIWVGRRS